MCNRCVTFYDNARFGMMSICSDISIGASVASLGALAPWLATFGVVPGIQEARKGNCGARRGHIAGNLVAIHFLGVIPLIRMTGDGDTRQ